MQICVHAAPAEGTSPINRSRLRGQMPVIDLLCVGKRTYGCSRWLSGLMYITKSEMPSATEGGRLHLLFPQAVQSAAGALSDSVLPLIE